MNPYAVDWGVTTLPVVVTQATFRGPDWREPTWEMLFKPVRIKPVKTPLLALLGKKGRGRG